MKKEAYPFVGDLLGGADFLAVDVGARGDLPPPWLVLDGAARVIGFDADPEAARKLETTYAARGNGDKYRALPVGLSGSGGTRTLHMTATPSGSSLLPVDTPLMRDYVDHKYLFPITTVPVETRRLDAVLDEAGEARVDMIKLDIQGLELEVLRTLGDGRIGQLMAFETEAAIDERRPGQARFCEIEAWAEAHGFELFDLRTSRLFRTRNGVRGGYQREVFGVHVTSQTIAGRLWELDALYFRSAESVLASGDAAAVRRLAVCYCTYNYFIEAHALIEAAEARGILPAQAAAAALSAVKAWHRRLRFRRIHAAGPLWDHIRHFFGRIGFGHEYRWCQYEWRRYPHA